jgi:hypothetical protein
VQNLQQVQGLRAKFAGFIKFRIILQWKIMWTGSTTLWTDGALVSMVDHWRLIGARSVAERWRDGNGERRQKLHVARALG